MAIEFDNVDEQAHSSMRDTIGAGAAEAIIKGLNKSLGTLRGVTQRFLVLRDCLFQNRDLQRLVSTNTTDVPQDL